MPVSPSRICACGGTKSRAYSERCDRCARAARRIARPYCLCGCGKPVARAGAVYATFSCKAEVGYQTWLSVYLADPTGVPTTINTSRHMKRYLRETRGEGCEECGWAKPHPVSGKIPTEVHHKDGNPDNGHPDNLQVLCPNCHSLTPNFKNRNKGGGRAGRVKRYAALAQR